MTENRQISFLVDKQELRLLNELIIVNEAIDNSLERTKLEGGKYRLKFSYDAIEELLGFLAASANHEKSERKQDVFDKLYDRVERLIKLSELVKAFGFYFDHPFGFYSNMVSINDSSAGYELFVDIGEEPLTPHFKGVKKTKISEAFSNIGTKMLFFFDYGDEWHFIVELKEIRDVLPNESLPVLLESKGKAPIQYPPCE